ncbi:hypothetical protein AB0J68_26370 [Micromonospora sp. NPDC049580]|uniref:hypothetical protein n=1 Tax=Micromonospora sp. NPDC049580 TaxID=3154832 RepID=UPI00341D08B1
MSRTLKVILGTVLLVGGTAGVVVLLTNEGLDRAEKWVSIGGVIASVLAGAGGLALSWLAWRHPQAGAGARRRAKSPGSSVGAGGGHGATGSATPRGVDVRGSKGVQIGDDNTQHNTF